jgi:excisionase family DNA binding protein
MGESAAITATLDELRAQVRELRGRVAELEAGAESRCDVLTIEGAARLLGCSRRSVERLVEARKIPHSRIHGSRGVRFIRSDLLGWLRNGCPRPGTPRLHSRLHHPGSATGR